MGDDETVEKDPQQLRALGVGELLGRYVVLPSEDPDHRRAAALQQRLFSEGLHFLTLPFVEQHAESQRRIDLLDEDDLRAELQHLVGERFVEPDAPLPLLPAA